MKRKRMNTMPALLKFLVLLALVLLGSHANAFTSLSSVAGNQLGQSFDSITATNEQFDE
jgi:hypothetical protein